MAMRRGRVRRMLGKVKRRLGGLFRRKKSRGVSAGTAKWVGRVGFYEARDTLISKGMDPESATLIVGKAKGLANKRGWLKKEHRYGAKAK